MISWGETGAPGASVACTSPATFGPSYVAGAVDQMPAAAAIRAAIAARTTILRIVSPSAAVVIAFAYHRWSPAGGGAHRVVFFVGLFAAGDEGGLVYPPRSR